MSARSPIEIVAHDLRVALTLAVVMEFSFAASLLALNGAFNGGRPTTTPAAAQAYFAVGLVVTVAVIIRTWQMLQLAKRGDVVALGHVHLQVWTLTALLFSGILPSIYLNAAAMALPRE